MLKFAQLFPKCLSRRPAVIAMVHVRALPGAPRAQQSIQELVDIACHEAGVYKRFNVDGVMLENMHDIPYASTTGPEVTATMSRVATEVKKIVGDTPVGVQVLACQNREAMAVALAANLQFIRVENFVFGHLADEGLAMACAGDLLRYQRQIGAENVLILTDIKKKHSSHAITSDLSIREVAEAAKFFLSDGLIVTGTSTGSPADIQDVVAAKQVKDIPVIIGSGVNHENAEIYSNSGADAFIVGSYFKESGLWSNEIDEKRIELLMSAMHLMTN